MARMKDVEVVTFKADKDLIQLLKGIRNRSEFIRAAILEALDNLCPFCCGAGILTPHRKEHWKELMKHHALRECQECHDPILVCGH